MKHLLLVLLLVLFTSLSYADVKYATSTTMEFGGTMGTMLKLFGAGKPVQSVDYYKGDVKRSDTFDGDKLQESQIIDLDKELFINIDHKSKQYTQMTFDEWRQMIEATMEQMGQDYESEEPQAEEPEPESESDVEWDLKVDVDETGKTETIAGKPTENVVLTLDLDAEVTSQEEGQEPETAKGGMVVTSNNWLYKGEDAAQKEMQAFNKALVQKLGMEPNSANFKSMMAKAIQENSALGEAIEKMQEEGAKLEGIAMRTNTVYETKVDPETVKKMNEEKAKEEEEEKEIPTSVGGLLGGFGKKLIKKQLEKKDEGPKERNTLMTTTTEVDELSTASLDASLFSVPADYKEVEPETAE